MKKLFALLPFLVLFQTLGNAQSRASVNDEPMELEDGIIVTYALWAAPTNVLNYYLNKRSLWVRDDELNKWLKSYNKQKSTNYSFINRSIQSNKVVLASKDYIDEMKAKVAAGDPGDNFRSENELRPNAASNCGEFVVRAGREFLFVESGSYKFPLQAGIHFTQNNLLDAASVYTNDDKTGGQLLDGKVSLRVYDKNKTVTMAHYKGGMKNGLMDGYGLFIKRDAECKEGFIRKGPWKAGVFIKEGYMNRLQEELRKTVLFNVNAPDIKTNIEEASFNTDPLLPEMDNGYLLKVNYTWSVGEKNRQIRVCMYAGDYSAGPSISILDKDGWEEIYFVKQQRSLEQGNMLNNLFSMAVEVKNEIVERNTVLHDDYLRYYIPSWSSVGDRQTIYNYGDPMDFTFIFLDVRDKKSGDWKQIGRIKIFRNKSTTAVEDISVEEFSFLTHRFRPRYNTAGEIVKELIPVIKKKYPDPLADNSFEKQPVVIQNKHWKRQAQFT